MIGLVLKTLSLNYILSLIIIFGNPSHASLIQVYCLSVYRTWLGDYSAFPSFSLCSRLLYFCFNFCLVFPMSYVFGSAHHVCRFLMLNQNHKGKQDTITPLPNSMTIFVPSRRRVLSTLPLVFLWVYFLIFYCCCFIVHGDAGIFFYPKVVTTISRC